MASDRVPGPLRWLTWQPASYRSLAAVSLTGFVLMAVGLRALFGEWAGPLGTATGTIAVVVATQWHRLAKEASNE